MNLRVTTDGRSAVGRERETRPKGASRNGERGAKRRASQRSEREPRDGEREAERPASREADRREASSGEAGGERVVVDSDDPTARWRWRCPNRHCDWEPTNSHIWCATCASLHEVDPEYWVLLDTKTGERVPWGAVEFR